MQFSFRCGLLGAVWGGVGFATEALLRSLAAPALRDNRLDSLYYLEWSVAAGLVFGFSAGAMVGFFGARLWSLEFASIIPMMAVVFARGVLWVLEPLVSEMAAAWVAMLAGTVVAGMIASVGSRHLTRRWPRGIWLTAAVVPLVLLGFAYGRTRVGPEPREGSPSLLLITVDTLRADALGAFRNGRTPPPGLERSRTDNLDGLARRGFAFQETSTPIPKTPQAISSIMTGVYPSQHEVTDLFTTLGRTNFTLAERLRDLGWTTVAVVNNGLIDRSSGLAQGFDRYRDRTGLRFQVRELSVMALVARAVPSLMQRALDRFDEFQIAREVADETTDRAIATLDSIAGDPFFLWVHYLDPHWTYAPPEPFRSQVDPEAGAPFSLYEEVRSGELGIGELIHENTMPQNRVERTSALYAGEVNYTDHEIGRLLETLSNSPAGGSTVVVVTSDHGESLGEHDYFFSHGDLVYEPSMRVPLIITVPGHKGGKSIQEPVSLVDLVPTLQELLGTQVSDPMEGQSLVPLMMADREILPEDGEAALYGESDLSFLPENENLTIPGEAGKIRSIRIGPYKLIRIPRDLDKALRLDPTLGSENAGREHALGLVEATRLGPSSPDIHELYDLSTDPEEMVDIASLHPEQVWMMTKKLDLWLERTLRGHRRDKPATKELLETLESLGYIDGRASDN